MQVQEEHKSYYLLLSGAGAKTIRYCLLGQGFAENLVLYAKEF